MDRSKYVSAYVACSRYALYLGLLSQNPGIVSGRTDLFRAVVSAVAVITMAPCLASVSDTTYARFEPRILSIHIRLLFYRKTTTKLQRGEVGITIWMVQCTLLDMPALMWVRPNRQVRSRFKYWSTQGRHSIPKLQNLDRSALVSAAYPKIRWASHVEPSLGSSP